MVKPIPPVPPPTLTHMDFDTFNAEFDSRLRYRRELIKDWIFWIAVVSVITAIVGVFS